MKWNKNGDGAWQGKARRADGEGDVAEGMRYRIIHEAVIDYFGGWT